MPPVDADTSVHTRLAAVEKGINALLTAQGLVIDTVQQQTNLLSELAAAAKGESEDSPIVDAIESLTGAVVKMGAGLETMRHEMGQLPDRLMTVLSGDDGPQSQNQSGEGAAKRPAP